LILCFASKSIQVDKSERIGLIEQDELELNHESSFGGSGGYGTASVAAVDLPIENTEPR